MDTAMRDLEQIREREPDDGGLGSRAGVFLMASVLTLGVVYGVGALMAEGPTPSQPDDPLAALGGDLGLREAAEEAAEAPVEPVDVDRESLAFHATLGGDDRPEVEAAIAAARAEHASLVNVVMPPAALPAAVAAAPEHATLVDTARNDPLVAAALPNLAEPAEDRGRVGRDGEYTLQVASFRTQEEADEFAGVLRERGHDSFVTRAEVDGRGTFFRVRVGPFETARAAGAYRRGFEGSERMNSYVVRNRD